MVTLVTDFEEENKTHIATEHVVEQLKIPKFDNKYNLLEIPRAIFDLSGEKLLIENLGEKDKKKLIVFSEILKKYDIKSVSIVNNNYLFLFEHV